MTPADFARLRKAFQAPPAFKLLSPEGQVGYPAEVLKLNKDQLARLIETRRAYEDTAQRLEGEAEVPPVPDEPAASPAD